MLLALILASPSLAQVPVALMPSAHVQFFSATGAPLAGGCISTFAAGTSTPLATYVDVNGVILNANPLTLDSGGFATIYLSNAEYKIQVNAAPPSGSCTPSNLGAQIWVQDNVSAWQILNNANNIFLLGVTSDPSGVAGEIGYRSDIPCFRAFTTLWDCVAQLNLTQTLTNKTLTSPTLNTPMITNPAITGGGSWIGSPSLTTPVLSGVNAQTGTSYTVAATDEQRLVTFNNASATTVTLPAATTAGFGSGTKFSFKNQGVGIVTITPTTSTIDGAASLTINLGQGVDVYSDGANYSTQGGRSSSGFKVECTNTTPVTVANTTAASPLQLCTIPANDMGLNQTFELEAMGQMGSSTSPNESLQVFLQIDGTLNLNVGQVVSLGPANNQGWNYNTFFTVTATGVSGSAVAAPAMIAMEGMFHSPGSAGSTVPVTIDTTVSHTIGIYVQWNDATVSNTITGVVFVVKRIN